MKFSSLQRSETINEMKNIRLDFLIIGGGIKGAGIPLERQQKACGQLSWKCRISAAGTSSRSTKLVHGGLRYPSNRRFVLQYRLGLCQQSHRFYGENVRLDRKTATVLHRSTGRFII
ncbi:FAD-dependent oxidoreductase [Planococcus sp. 1R117A]|uniref:FAD-dependent oxidoreductase n=1 Tax=Planococcus sp. 1R117A TaxID=3447020 RepID=UPI003EDBAA0B